MNHNVLDRVIEEVLPNKDKLYIYNLKGYFFVVDHLVLN